MQSVNYLLFFVFKYRNVLCIPTFDMDRICVTQTNGEEKRVSLSPPFVFYDYIYGIKNDDLRSEKKKE